ncbi:Tyrosine-protein phosphatase 69D, partial [Gryllus bimaculatus]
PAPASASGAARVETTTALPEDTATTATTLPAPGDGEPPTPTDPAAPGPAPAPSVNTFLRITVQTSWEILCRDREAFRAALDHMASERFGKNVTVVVAGLGSGAGATECERMHVDSTGETRLLPVTVYLLDERGRFDKQLVESFYMVVSQPQQPSPLQITRVDLMYGPLPTTSSDSNAGVIAAITISCVGAICLLLLAALLIIMRKRQKRFNYGQRCTPVSLDAYSLDSVSVYDSVRRKGALRASKRSYGNPAFDDPGAPSHPMNFAGLANFSSDRAALEEEFEMVPQVTPKSDELPEGAETKNRYSNVIPLPETRVQLSLVEGEQLSDYINANYVKGPKNENKFYIACQAPLPSTVTDFWRMIWEQQSKVILMLTDLVENGVEKCADYMPPSEVLDCHRLFGDFQITLKKREEREKYVISTLQLKNLETNSWREVTHLWYLSWPNQGVPDESNSIIAFLIEARPYMRSNTGPTVVHCSPGTGRTGTVLACDICIRDFEQTRMVDIPRCVYRLRRDRAGAVKTKDQYVFIYQVLNTYATKLTGGGGSLDSI